MRIEPQAVEQGRHDDLDLVSGSLRGDEESVAGLALRLACVPRILGSINQSMGYPIGAEDLADLSQDTLAVIWGKLGTFEGRGRLETWSYRFCFLEFMNRWRRLERRQKVFSAGPETLEAVAGPAHPSGVELGEFELLESSLDELGPPDSDVIRMKHFDGQTFQQISERLDMASSTVKSRYYRGLEWLKRHLEPLLRQENG